MGMFRSQGGGGAPDIPIAQVSAMKQQGYSNNQIIQSLQRDGFTSSQIFDAIAQSETNSGIPNAPPIGGGLPPGMDSQMQGMGMMQQMPQMQQQMPQQQPIQSFRQSSNEELIESIIEEKWNDLVKDINKVIEWKQKADARLTAMEQQVADVKSQFDKVHQALIGKVADYDKHMLEVGAEVQAMEKVFSKVLPNFIDNVNELNRITDKMKLPEREKEKEKAPQTTKQPTEETESKTPVSRAKRIFQDK